MTAQTQRAIGYVRVSTQQQADHGASLEVQRAAILGECDRRGWILSSVQADEGLSGGSLKKRDGLRTALDQLRCGQADVLVVSRLDRLSRSMFDFATLIERATKEGWELAVLDYAMDMSTPQGEMLAYVLMAFGHMQRRLIALHTKEALAVKAAQGVAIGRPHSVPSEVVEEVRRLRTSGSTYQAIADALNERGVPTGQGGRCWQPGSVSAVLNRKRAAT